MRLEEFVEGDELVVRAELPGVDPDKDVTITLDRGRLTIAAERKDGPFACRSPNPRQRRRSR